MARPGKVWHRKQTGWWMVKIDGKQEKLVQGPKDEKHTPTFFFQCIRADALDCGDFAQGRTQAQNVKAVLDDIKAPGNEKALFPGQMEADAAALSRKHGGLLFTDAEMKAFADIAAEAGVELDLRGLKTIEV